MTFQNYKAADTASRFCIHVSHDFALQCVLSAHTYIYTQENLTTEQLLEYSSDGALVGQCEVWSHT